nr:olfactory receptor 12D2-like [Dasypus novemcinctus]
MDSSVIFEKLELMDPGFETLMQQTHTSNEVIVAEMILKQIDKRVQPRYLKKSISQLHFFHFLGSMEALLLGMMSFDCSVVISKLLHYTVIMNYQLGIQVASTVWVMGFFHALLHSIMTFHLNFCGSNHIHHFYCDVKSLLELACGNVDLQQMFQKGLTTCASHFMIDILFYVLILFTYICPASDSSMEQDAVIALMYCVVTPVLTPLIYTLRNKDVKQDLIRAIRRKL